MADWSNTRLHLLENTGGDSCDKWSSLSQTPCVQLLATLNLSVVQKCEHKPQVDVRQLLGGGYSHLIV